MAGQYPEIKGRKMDEPEKISLSSQQENSQNFAFLREEGLNVIRRLAPDTWTDHNIHDPGITLLEGISYAITEAGLLNEIEMQDLLASGEQVAPQEFFTASRVLTSAPVTTSDFQRILFDHPLINRAWVTVLPGEPQGRLGVLLEFERIGNMDINSNTISISVNVSGVNYQADIAFPYWDKPEMAALQSDLIIQSVAFITTEPPSSPVSPPVNPWRPIRGTDAYFTRMLVTWLESGSPGTFEAWVVMRITSTIANTALIVPVLEQTAVLLQITAANSILKQYNLRVTKAYEATREIRRYLKNYRNLCEVFTEYKAVRIQEIAFTANIEVAGNINVENLLAEIFFAVDQYISPEIIANSLSSLQNEGIETATIFEGPLPNYGFIGDNVLNTTFPLSKLYVSDIIRLIIQLRKKDGGDIQTREDLANRTIVAVSNASLSLYLENRAITTKARDCLQLIKSGRYIPALSPEKCRVIFIRNNAEVIYDITRVIQLFENKKSLASARNEPDTPDLPLPDGVSYPLVNYYPVQNDLPVTYGIGKAGLPASATATRKAQARQLKGYLFFFEQMIAGHFAQVAHVNDFFSANPNVQTTVFQQPLYQLPAVSDLFRSFVPTVPWEDSWRNFQADGNNPYRQVLKNSVETEEQFLDRRHRMLDHLLSRLGEDMKDYSDLTYRQNYSLAPASVPISPLVAPDMELIQNKLRLETSHRLLQDKSAFYYDLPYLDHSRAQAFGLPDQRKNSFIQIQSLNGGFFTWQIFDDSGLAILRQSSIEESIVEARRKAEEVMSLATSLIHFSTGVETDSGQFRIFIKSSVSSPAAAFSINTFIAQGDADTAVTEIREKILSAWVRYSLSPLELRLQYLLGLSLKGERRKLIAPFSDYFDIYDDASFRKHFRLLTEPGPAGSILLESEDSFAVTDDAMAALTDTIQYGVLSENFLILPLISGASRLLLQDQNGKVLAHSPVIFPDSKAAEEAKKQIRDHLYRYYGLEGFYMAEHLLLYPQSPANGLVVNDSRNRCLQDKSDRGSNYSFLISFIFPSGYSRDFSISSPLADPVRKQSQPDRFRDPEFREYAERTIRKNCPAHILPMVLWVDRDLNETPLPSDANNDFPCFDHFEARYRDWMTAFFTDEVPDTVIDPLRNNLITILNKLHESYQ